MILLISKTGSSCSTSENSTLSKNGYNTSIDSYL